MTLEVFFMKKSIKVLAVGSMIGFGTISPLPIQDATAVNAAVSQAEASLSVLDIAEFELDQTLAAGVYDYSASVDSSISQMSLTLATEDEDAIIAVNGESVTNHEETVLDLAAGKNVFTITLTDATGVTTYTVTVERAANSDTSLSGLLLSNGDLSFSSDVNIYSVDVDNDVSQLTVVPTASASTSIVQVNGTVASASGVAVEVPVGRSTITIVVTAENGDQKTYLISVKRASAAGNNSGGSSSSTGSSNASTPTNSTGGSGSVSSLGATTLAASSSARTSSATATAATSGSSMSSVSGASSSEAATTANLASLSLSTGTWNKTFDPDVYTYHIAVGTDVASVTISATADKSAAEVKVDGADSTTVALASVAKQAVSVTVTNGDDQKTYVLIFDKAITDTTATTTAVTATSIITTETLDTATESASTDNTNTKQATTQATASSTEATPSFWEWLKSLFGF